MAQNLKINILAKDKTKQAFNGIRGRLQKLKDSVISVKGAIVGIGAGLVIKSFVNVGKNVEDLQVRLKQLFGSTQEGAKAFDVMAKFASKVPFSLEQIQNASGNLAVVSRLSSQSVHYVSTKNKYGMTTLMRAIDVANKYNTVKMVQALVDAGADVNARNESGSTPLHGARTPEIAQALLNAGAQVNVRDEFGFTALHCAVGCPGLGTRAEIIQTLLDAGHVPVLILRRHVERGNVVELAALRF